MTTTEIAGYHIEKVYTKLFENDNQIVRFTLYDYFYQYKLDDLETCIQIYFKRFL